MDRRMCGKDFVLGLLFLFLWSGVGYAEIVSYYDEHGKIHYVNMDYGTVPVKYRDQIKSKEKVPAPVVKADNANAGKAPVPTDPVIPGKSFPAMVNGKVTIIVLSDGPLAPTGDLKLNLDVNKIPYILYNINTEPGKSIYKEMGGGTLPIVQVTGTTVLSGGSSMREVLGTIDSLKSCWGGK